MEEITTDVSSPSNLYVGLLVRHPDECGAILSIFDPHQLNLDTNSENPQQTKFNNAGLDSLNSSFIESSWYLKCMKQPLDIISVLDEKEEIIHEIYEGPSSLPTQFHWSHQSPSLHKLILPPTELVYFQQLNCLDLSSNSLTSLPLSLFTLTQLSELNLGYNQLTSLSPLIGCLLELQDLYLNANRLSSLPSTLSFCKKLKILDLSDNTLSWLPANLIQNIRLRKLWVDQNRFYEAFTSPSSKVYPSTLMLYPSLSSPPRLLQLSLQVAAKYLKEKGPHVYCRHAPNTRFTTSMAKHLLRQLCLSKEFATASRRSLEQVLMGLLQADEFDPSLLSHYLYGVHRDPPPTSPPSSSFSTSTSPTRSVILHSASSTSPKSKSLVPPPIQTHLIWGISATAPVLTPSTSSPLSTSSVPSPPSAYQHYCLFQILSSAMLWSLFLPQTLCSNCQSGIHLIPSSDHPLLFGTVHACPNEQWLPVFHELCSLRCWNKVTLNLWKKIKRVKPN